MHSLMSPLYTAVSQIMVWFHSFFRAIGLDPASGLTWGLSIIGLVIVIRILLIPLFVKQIKAQRGLQVLQPEIKKIQERYKNDRERQSQEMMKLYKETGTNPLSSCLPLLAQAPIFFALFGVLNGIAQNVARGVLTPQLVGEARNAEIFGARIFDTFLGAQNGAARVVAVVLIVAMSATTFFTQKQLMTKNMPASAMTGPFAQQQKILLYVFPLIFAVSGVNFPIGVLLYWFTTNIWSMGQQLYVIRRMPSPGTPAYDALQRKREGAGGPSHSGPRWLPGGALMRRSRQDRGSAGDNSPTPSTGGRTGAGRAGRGATAMPAQPAGDGTSPNGKPQRESPAPAPGMNGRAGSRQRQQPKRQPRAKRR